MTKAPMGRAVPTQTIRKRRGKPLQHGANRENTLRVVSAYIPDKI